MYNYVGRFDKIHRQIIYKDNIQGINSVKTDGLYSSDYINM